MQIERVSLDLVLTISDGRINIIPFYSRPSCGFGTRNLQRFSLRVLVSPKEFALHRKLFGTRFSKPPRENIGTSR